MSTIKKKLNEILERKNISYYRLSKITDFDESVLNRMINGKASFSSNLVEKIAPILEISPDTITGWIIADKYPAKTLKLAFEMKQNPPKPVKLPQQKLKPSKKTILANKIDEKILEKELSSRSQLSTLIGNNQNKLNQMIIGKKPMSDTTIQKIATFFEIPEDQIRAWIVADKYSLEALRVAVEEV